MVCVISYCLVVMSVLLREGTLLLAGDQHQRPLTSATLFTRADFGACLHVLPFHVLLPNSRESVFQQNPASLTIHWLPVECTLFCGKHVIFYILSIISAHKNVNIILCYVHYNIKHLTQQTFS